MKLAVTGSRHWTDRNAVWDALDAVTPRPTLIIHGGARGVDTFADEYARAYGVHCAVVRPIHPDRAWDYPLRNTVIVDLADEVLAFRAEGKSNGTDDTIRKAQAAGKLRAIVRLPREGGAE